MKGKRYLLIIVFLSMLFLPLITDTGSAQQVDFPPPEFSIRIRESSYSTEQSSYGTEPELDLDISGDVTIILPEGVPPNTECQLFLQIDSPYIVEDNKKYFYFDLENKLIPFSFEGIVEEYHPAGSKFEFNITGEWEYQDSRGSGEIRPISGTITVSPYSQISYEILNGNYRNDFNGVEQKEVEVAITNMGNAEDTITITNSNEVYLDIIIEEREITLAPQESTTIIIKLKPRAPDVLDDKIQITFKGSYDNRRSETDLILHVRSIHDEDESDDMSNLFPWMMVLLGVSVIILIVLFIIHRYEKKREKEAETFEEIEDGYY